MVKRLTKEDREELKRRFHNSKYGIMIDKFLREYYGMWLLNFVIGGLFGASFIFGSIVDTTYTQQPNIFYGLILWHIKTHHLLDIFTFGIGYSIMAAKLKNFIYPALFTFFVIGVTEYFWWISYIIANWQIVFAQQNGNGIFISTISIFYFAIIIGYVIIKGFSREEVYWLIANTIFFAFWISIGFPITYGYSGATIYLNVLWVNAIEVTHWLNSFTTYCIFVVRKMKIKNFRITWLK